MSHGGTWVSLEEAEIAWGPQEGPPVYLEDVLSVPGWPARAQEVKHSMHPDPAPVIPTFSSDRGPSPSILGPFVAAFLVVVSSLLVAILLSGCSSVSQSEYRALVEAATSYRDAVAPTFRASIENDAQLSERSKKTRLSLDDDFQAARPSWEKRAGIVKDEAAKCPDIEMAPGGNYYVCTGPPCLLFFWVGPHAHEGAVVRALR